VQRRKKCARARGRRRRRDGGAVSLALDQTLYQLNAHHRDADVVAGEKDLLELDDVRVAHQAVVDDLGLHVLVHLGARQQLDGDQLLRLHVARQVDAAKRAAAQHLDRLILETLAEHVVASVHPRRSRRRLYHSQARGQNNSVVRARARGALHCANHRPRAAPAGATKACRSRIANFGMRVFARDYSCFYASLSLSTLCKLYKDGVLCHLHLLLPGRRALGRQQ
jgi:hypothetical protein